MFMCEAAISIDGSRPLKSVMIICVTFAEKGLLLVSVSNLCSRASLKKANRDFVIIPILLELPRSELYAHINQRVLDMIDAGWLDEAKQLYPYRELKALNTVGYKELFSYLEDAISKIQQSTRNYAKRQLTWWRNQGTWHSFHPGDVNGIIQLINSIN